jgi:hypothetical protein
MRGLEVAAARRFVSIAGADLVHSFAWQTVDLDLHDLTSMSNVTRLLGGMHAQRIASVLRIPVGDVWASLRVFVPEVLTLAAAWGRVGEARVGHSYYVGPSTPESDRPAPLVTTS